MATFRAAVVQAAPIVFDRVRTLEKLEDLVADVARAGVDLAVFPEAFVGGYPKGHDFGTRLGRRSDEGRAVFGRYVQSAVDIPSGHIDRMAKAARDGGVHLVVGVIERDGGTLYCTAVFFSPDGRLLGKHRKLMPTALERVVWGFGDGSTMPVLTTAVGRLGAVICWENYMPLLRTAMYAKGIELYCAPTVDDRDTWFATMRHIACEGRCFVFSACPYLEGRHCPSDIPDPGTPPDHVLIRGGSGIVGPLGEVLVGPVFGKEETLVAEIDLSAIARAKLDFDPVGHYARPDVFRLTVDERRKEPVDRITDDRFREP